MQRMTACPNRDHCVQVSTRIRPVTQEEDVAVNSAVNTPALCPSREAAGSVSSSVPARMIRAKEPATRRVALRLRLRIRRSRSQRAIFLIKEVPPEQKNQRPDGPAPVRSPRRA